jgi:hypothetical protein
VWLGLVALAAAGATLADTGLSTPPSPELWFVGYGPLGIFVVLFVLGYVHSPRDQETRRVCAERDKALSDLAELNRQIRADILGPTMELNRLANVILDRLTEKPSP